MSDDSRPELAAWRERVARTLDEHRGEARTRRHDKGYRTARENVDDLVDAGSFQEYGQLAVAAQRSRRDYLDLQSNTAGDGIITGTCTINAALVAPLRAGLLLSSMIIRCWPAPRASFTTKNWIASASWPRNSRCRW